MRADVKRVELERIRVCQRCGRGAADLRADDGVEVVVTLDAVRTRTLTHANEEELRSLTDLVLERLDAGGREAAEVVLDLADGRLRALLSFDRDGDPDVVTCTADEGVALVARGGLRLYATDEALAHAAGNRGLHEHDDGGPDETVH